jgi:hypothetical protein
VVVLNLAIQYKPSVISETFTLSLLTAVLLKLALEVVILLDGEILTRLHAADTRPAKIVAVVSLWGGCGRQQVRRPARVAGRGTPPPG